MAADHSSRRRPDSVPPFECSLPESLLKGLSERERWMYEQSDKQDQKLEWLMKHSLAHGETLGEVKAQCERTNGRLLAAEGDIKAIKENTAPIIQAYTFAGKLARSRFFWAGAAAFIIFGIPFLITHAPAPTALLKWAFGIGTLGL